jgi:hypothetical protein
MNHDIFKKKKNSKSVKRRNIQVIFVRRPRFFYRRMTGTWSYVYVWVFRFGFIEIRKWSNKKLRGKRTWNKQAKQ